MQKQHIKNILFSMRTPENEAQVNILLGKIDMMSEENINQYLEKFGISEENIRPFLKKKLQFDPAKTTKKLYCNSSQFIKKPIPINNMFTYGTARNCVHLHLPGNLQDMLNSIGFSKTFNTVNLSLLDAILQIKTLKDNNNDQFSNINKIYMISPILIGKELKFLDEMDFQTTLYTKDQLQNPKFKKEHSEAFFATHLFGNNKNIGTACISFDTLNTPEWQEKCKNKMRELKQKTSTLQKENEK